MKLGNECKNFKWDVSIIIVFTTDFLVLVQL